jgi:hypothetical protein
MPQVIECLPSRHKALSSISSTEGRKEGFLLGTLLVWEPLVLLL